MQIVHEFPTAGHQVFWKPYPWFKILKNMLNASSENLSTTIRNLFNRLAFLNKHYICKYSGEVSLIINFLWMFIGSWLSVSKLEYKSRKHWDFTLCPSSTVTSTFNPRLIQSLEIPKQISYVLRGIKQAISRKLVKISDFPVRSLKQFLAAGYLDTSYFLTRKLLALILKQWVLLFHWLAHLDNKSNVYKQEISLYYC